MPNVDHSAATAPEIAARAARAGVRRVIVLDLARVGAGAGVDLDVLVAVRLAAPGTALVAGGGVRDLADLEALRTVGCDGALVASALISGALTCNSKVAHFQGDV
jgi:phosphoribosylformimino-5-aminoimidazole carboxamide ribotide isomerase